MVGGEVGGDGVEEGIRGLEAGSGDVLELEDGVAISHKGKFGEMTHDNGG
jgi:hypothetical protein